MNFEVRRDERYLGRCRLALAAIVLAMPPTVAAMALAPGWGLVAMPAWLAYSAAIVWWGFARPLELYRCPRCGRPLPRAEEARPWIRFRCKPCGVEWDVERSEGDGGGE